MAFVKDAAMRGLIPTDERIDPCDTLAGGHRAPGCPATAARHANPHAAGHLS